MMAAIIWAVQLSAISHQPSACFPFRFWLHSHRSGFQFSQLGSWRQIPIGQGHRTPWAASVERRAKSRTSDGPGPFLRHGYIVKRKLIPAATLAVRAMMRSLVPPRSSPAAC
jgi:hypothetical protein